MNVGKKIKLLRESKGYSLRQFEDKTGINYNYLYKIEKGDRRVNEDILRKLCDVFGLNWSYFDEGYTKEEDSLLNDLVLSDEELMEKYNLIVDGKQVSEKEIKWLLNQIRTLRELDEE